MIRPALYCAQAESLAEGLYHLLFVLSRVTDLDQRALMLARARSLLDVAHSLLVDAWASGYAQFTEETARLMLGLDGHVRSLERDVEHSLWDRTRSIRRPIANN